METEGEKKDTRIMPVSRRHAQHVIDKRVNMIGAWLIQGHRRSTIIALVSEAVKQESEKRRAARAESKQLPPYVWGDVDPPCTPQMIGKYIRKARDVFELKGRALPKAAVEELGLTYEMLHDLYWRALADKRYTVCRALIRDKMEMFGFVGAMKLQLVSQDTPTGAAEPDTSHLPETEHTAEQLEAEWHKLLTDGLARVRANPDQRYLPPVGIPVRVTPAPTGHDEEEEPDE